MGAPFSCVPATRISIIHHHPWFCFAAGRLPKKKYKFSSFRRAGVIAAQTGAEGLGEAGSQPGVRPGVRQIGAGRENHRHGFPVPPSATPPLLREVMMRGACDGTSCVAEGGNGCSPEHKLSSSSSVVWAALAALDPPVWGCESGSDARARVCSRGEVGRRAEQNGRDAIKRFRGLVLSTGMGRGVRRNPPW